MPELTAQVLTGVLRRAPGVAPDGLLGIVREEAISAGVRVRSLFLVDLEQRALNPFPGSLATEPQGVDATLAGRAYRMVEVVDIDGEEGWRRLYVPLLDGSERLGVFEVEIDEGRGRAGADARALANLLAEYLVSKRMYGDVVARTRRRRDMRLAAEIQWELLPPLTLAVPTVTVSGILEPCYEIGGDVFDYAYNTPVVHLLVCDAMGHGLDSSMMASLLMGSYRNSRRAGDDLVMSYHRMNELVARRFGPERFATAQLAEFDCRDGTLRWVNAGHPPAMLLREGSVVGRLESPPFLPIGFAEDRPEVARVQLQPGDVVLWFTDGVVEARSPEGGFFGEDRLADLLVKAVASGTPVPEIVRRLTHAVLDHQSGALQDDATMLYLHWKEPLR